MELKELKVLLVSPLPPPAGGIATWTEQYIDWFEKNKLRVDIVNTAVLGRRAKRINAYKSLFDEFIRTRHIVRDMHTKIKEFSPNVIHLNSPCAKLGIIRDYLCALIAKKRKVKLVVHYRCNIEDQVKKNFVQLFFLKKLSRTADKNLVLNKSSKDFLLKKFGHESTLIANFINEEFIINEPKIINENIGMISYVGHVQKTKGVFEIFEVAKNFSEIEFVLAGPVANEVSNVKLPPNVKLLGPLNKDAIRVLYEKSDIFLFPSYTEGFANALLEAMSMGLPIITTQVGANSDMVEKEGGLIVDIGSTIDIINSIIFLGNKTSRLKMSRWNVNKVKNEYTTDMVMKKLCSLYLITINQNINKGGMY